MTNHEYNASSPTAKEILAPLIGQIVEKEPSGKQGNRVLLESVSNCYGNHYAAIIRRPMPGNKSKFKARGEICHIHHPEQWKLAA